MRISHKSFDCILQSYRMNRNFLNNAAIFKYKFYNCCTYHNLFSTHVFSSEKIMKQRFEEKRVLIIKYNINIYATIDFLKCYIIFNKYYFIITIVSKS